MQKLIPFLMFEGRAEEAMNFYISLFADSKIMGLDKYGPESGEAEGKIRHAAFMLNGQGFMCIDSPTKHAFTFTPSMSIYVNCTSEEELDTVYNALAEGGNVMMPLGKYPFADKYAWLSDKFGVSWQLGLGLA